MKLNSFVDDLTTYTETEDDFKVAVQCIVEYCDIFKLQLNRNKCEMLSLGDEVDEVYEGIPRKEKIKILGVFFQRSWSRTESENWINTISKFKNALRQGYGRGLTVHQRAQYVNTYACPVLWYLSFVSQPKKTHLKQIVSAIYQYIWNENFHLN